MQVKQLAIPDVICFTPQVFGDDRGFFYESFNQRVFEQALGKPPPQFVQDNHSRSVKGVLRGLHYQIQHSQGKLVRVTQGEVFDVAVDIRKSSPTFGKWVGETLSAQNNKQIWVPPGFAHGFIALEENTLFSYKCTNFYSPEHEKTIKWNDPILAINWGDVFNPIISEKDQVGQSFIEFT